MSERHIIPKRNELKPEDTWSTEDLYPSDGAFWEAFTLEKEKAQALTAYEGRLGESGTLLYRYFQEKEEAEEAVERLYTYTSLKSDEDTKNSVYQGMKGQMMSWLVQWQQEMAFETPELIALTEEQLAAFYREEPKLALYRRYLERVRRKKAHILSPSEEALLAAAGEMADAPDRIYGNFVNADLTFPSVQDTAGTIYPLTNGSYGTLMLNQDRCLREEAFQHLYETYEKFKNTTAAILNAHVRQNVFFARARKYGSCLEAALDRTEVPVAVYHQLIQAVHENMQPMYDYMAFRKRQLGVEELHMYDLYVPVVGDAEEEISFERAKEDVIDALGIFGEEYQAVLKSSFEQRWMDIYENEGKRSGAYSCGAKVHPFILLNHKDTLNSEFTLVHELGHAMHSYLSNQNQPAVYADYVIFVAEVASTCNEALLMHYLLNRTKDKKRRAYLLNYFLEQFRTTLYRQTMFAEFEEKIHAMAEEGEALTADVLKNLYYQLNQLYYGEHVTVDEEIAIEWARVPHFYYNFYVYQYATGFAAAIALSQRILKEGKPAVEDYLRFLKGGCSTDPISLLKIAGVDMTTAEPVEKALQYFKGLLAEMEELMA
ncbi:oligoendopeptidase F [Hominifimenecus sp. rT4P-3]|uniref:oligoendopeptidase F n=1 Tax=Hominifimenecus sp. rT4P-3 TaxID=3242979 RepID=UPI003DA37E61